jgi:hypothetical protein
MILEMLEGWIVLRQKPELLAEQVVNRDFLPQYDYALQTLKDTSAAAGGETTTLRTRCDFTPCARRA